MSFIDDHFEKWFEKKKFETDFFMEKDLRDAFEEGCQYVIKYNRINQNDDNINEIEKRLANLEQIFISFLKHNSPFSK